jgi:hypothetical protein
MADLETISSLATGAGTLVLAIATFASVRSANRAARLTEEALLINVRPLLMPSRLDDVSQKVFFQEGKYVVLDGGRGSAEFENNVVYFAMSLRNAGHGIAVLHGWRFLAGQELNPPRPDPAGFRILTRDIMVAPGEIGFWQGTFRDTSDPQYDEALTATKDGLLSIDLMYGDDEGGQRMISRMTLRRMGEDSPSWLVSVVRHWNMDRPDPRDRA